MGSTVWEALLVVQVADDSRLDQGRSGEDAEKSTGSGLYFEVKPMGWIGRGGGVRPHEKGA